MGLASNGLPPWLFPVNAQKSSMFYRKWDRSQAPAPASGAHYHQEGWSTGASSPGLTSVPRWPSPGPGMGLMPTGWCPGSSREPSPTWRGAPKHGGSEGRYHLRPLGGRCGTPSGQQVSLHRGCTSATRTGRCKGAGSLPTAGPGRHCSDTQVESSQGRPSSPSYGPANRETGHPGRRNGLSKAPCKPGDSRVTRKEECLNLGI